MVEQNQSTPAQALEASQPTSETPESQTAQQTQKAPASVTKALPSLDQLRSEHLYIRRILAERPLNKDYEQARQTLQRLKADPASFNEQETHEALAQSLVGSIDRLDYREMHVEWLPAFKAVLKLWKEQKKYRTKLLTLNRIFDLCAMTSSCIDDPEKVADYSVASGRFVDLLSIVEIEQTFEFGETDVNLMLYAVASTSQYGFGFEQVCDVELLKVLCSKKALFMSSGQLEREGIKPLINASLLTLAREFSEDLASLHPLRKLRGANVNKESRSRLPNLTKTTIDFADDLIMAIKEILQPEDSIKQCQSWQNSRLRIVACRQMIQHLRELGAPAEIQAQCFSQVSKHLEALQDSNPSCSDLEYYTESFKMLHSTSDSALQMTDYTALEIIKNCQSQARQGREALDSELAKFALLDQQNSQDRDLIWQTILHYEDGTSAGQAVVFKLIELNNHIEYAQRLWKPKESIYDLLVKKEKGLVQIPAYDAASNEVKLGDSQAYTGRETLTLDSAKFILDLQEALFLQIDKSLFKDDVHSFLTLRESQYRKLINACEMYNSTWLKVWEAVYTVAEAGKERTRLATALVQSHAIIFKIWMNSDHANKYYKMFKSLMQTATQDFNRIFGENSDELHYLMVTSNKSIFKGSFYSYVNFFGPEFLKHVQTKFSDLRIKENLDAQIFYHTQQVRIEVGCLQPLTALSLIPKLISLLNELKKQASPEEQNRVNFRIGVTVQDMAQLKVQIGNPEDALLHLSQSEEVLRGVKAEPGVVDELLLKVTLERNHELFKQARAESEAKKIPKLSYQEWQRSIARQDKIYDVVFATAPSASVQAPSMRSLVKFDLAAFQL